MRKFKFECFGGKEEEIVGNQNGGAVYGLAGELTWFIRRRGETLDHITRYASILQNIFEKLK